MKIKTIIISLLCAVVCSSIVASQPVAAKAEVEQIETEGDACDTSVIFINICKILFNARNQPLLVNDKMNFKVGLMLTEALQMCDSLNDLKRYRKENELLRKGHVPPSDDRALSVKQVQVMVEMHSGYRAYNLKPSESELAQFPRDKERELVKQLYADIHTMYGKNLTILKLLEQEVTKNAHLKADKSVKPNATVMAPPAQQDMKSKK